MTRACLPTGALLFVPAEERRLAKIPKFSHVSAIVIDLEDAIAHAGKRDARARAASAVRNASGDRFVAVRVNNTPELLGDDLSAVVGANVHCVMLPMTSSPRQVWDLAERLSALERMHGLEECHTSIIALIETAAGVAKSEAIAATGAPRLLTLALGNADLAADLGLPPDGLGEGLSYARSRLVIAARAAGLVGAVDGPYPKIRDLDGLVEDSRHSRRLGCRGRLVLHPDHVSLVDSAYAGLAAADLEFARRVVAEFSAMAEEGQGGLVIDDSYVDLPVYERCKRLLEQEGVA